MSWGSGSTSKLHGDWYCNGVMINGSDKHIKNTIHSMTDVYDVLFDNLSPVIFKFNEGTSDRIHTGFIAQDVAEATENAGLTTKDFAAVCYDIDDNNEKVNWGVRYGEIVSLNTWQIQKAKARITELEERVAQLEKLLKE
jgi:hypothetical protein